MSHVNARLALAGRLTLVQRIQSGRPVARVASEMGVSRTTAWPWWRRLQEAGVLGLRDRSSVARSHPRRTRGCVETRVRIVRALTRRGPVFIAGKLGMRALTVGRVLRRHHTPLLRELDPVTGTRIRAERRRANRYEHEYPGSLIHIDVKKLGRIPDGGGWRLHGRSERPHRKRGQGYDYVHTVIDDHSRVAYAEIHDDEKGVTAAGVLERAIRFYASLGVSVSSATTRSRTDTQPRSATSSPDTASNNDSFARTAPGRTGKSNASTARSRPNGYTRGPGPPTTNAEQD